jgi:hypothetical protein
MLGLERQPACGSSVHGIESWDDIEELIVRRGILSVYVKLCVFYTLRPIFKKKLFDPIYREWNTSPEEAVGPKILKKIIFIWKLTHFWIRLTSIYSSKSTHYAEKVYQLKM